MSRVLCGCCGQLVEVDYSKVITFKNSLLFDDNGHEAAIYKKAICPCCGISIKEHLEKIIYTGDIVLRMKLY